MNPRSFPNSPRVLLIGASCRAMALSALRAGWQPVCADLFADSDLRSVAEVIPVRDYPVSLPQDVASVQANAWCYTGGLENSPEIVNQLAACPDQFGPLWGVAPAALDVCRDPFKLQKIWLNRGFPTPELRRNQTQVPTDGSWLRKRFRSSAGLGVSLWDESSAKKPANLVDSYFQRKMPGQPMSALFVVWKENAGAGKGAFIQFLGCTRQLVAPNTFLYAGNTGPIELPQFLTDRLIGLVTAVASRCQLRGLIGLDFLLDRETIWPLEINPRYTAAVEVLEYAGNWSALQYHRAACEAQPPPESQTKTAKSVVGKRIVYAPRAGLFMGELPDSHETSFSILPTLADIPAYGSLIQTGAPVCTVFATANCLEDCEAMLIEAESDVLRKAFPVVGEQPA